MIEPDFDAIVIGAGFSGIYQTYKLREAGFSVKGIEAAPDVGGVWFWNRYPGCRVDSESHTYGYFWLDELVEKFNWTERFAGQPEVLKYIQTAADLMDIRKDYTFNQRVKGAKWDDDNKFWIVELEEGGSAPITARFLFSAMGPLSAPQMPNVPGVHTFKGEWYHTARWPRDPESNSGAKLDFSGKRVAVIGTGSSGVQIIQEMAKVAGELVVFQRSPNWCTPLGNGPLPASELDHYRRNREQLNDFLNTTFSGFAHKPIEKNAIDLSAEEREATYEELYKGPGFRLWQGNYQDSRTDPQSNELVSEFVRKKIRERVKNPRLADKLIPQDHGFGTRRVPLETNYYEVYNQNNVSLVDLKETPLDRIEPTGIRTSDGQLREFDVIIYATGFYAIKGALCRFEVRGRDGRLLNDLWNEDGVKTYLGLQIANFPNFFTLVGPQNGTVFCNIPRCSVAAVDWVMEMLEHARETGVLSIEPTAEAQEQWNQSCYELLEKSLIFKIDSWLTGVNKNIRGANKREALFYAGGNPAFRALCAEIAEDDYRGFVMTRIENEVAPVSKTDLPELQPAPAG
ncbi:flavin-containing monooxygenase [Sphingobium sp. CCH11-B1]|uniref:flavin-containing monooxygenase n=1 Tax=Sphingobium sp. CCH11-B1 TaxID=1768781 RepID=UPI0009EC1F25|nr:NAD(P)/FAD-dependent oxidoreductase [Sphingobium sp. CCH11-B1]MEA3389956.1 NAD(P)/FAD-dependent oxidoreductase [Pseudomonadota bacterium]